jgi:alkylation response protein AidB-like acyl-CoA dehydrogenase
MNDPFPAYAPSEEHELLRATVRKLAEDKIAPAAADVDERSRYPQEALDALTGARLHAVHIPSGYGGEGADALATVIVIEEVARVCASSSLIPVVNKLGTVPVLLSASEELKKRYLAPVARGEAMFSYAMSEAGAGSDAASMKTRAVRDRDGWVLNGTKMWITNAGVSQYYTVMAVTDPDSGANGISAFVVDKDDPGVSFGALAKKLGIKGSPTRTVIFEDARIPADRMIGAEGTGFKTALATLDHTRITIAAQALGIAQGALDYAAGYVKQREQFGQPVASFQGVQFMLADMAMKLEAARQLTYHAAILSERAMQGEKQPGLTFASSAAKCFASDAAMEITTDAVQLLGGYGYVKDYPVERMMRDAKISQIYEGTNQIQRLVMARQLLRAIVRPLTWGFLYLSCPQRAARRPCLAPSSCVRYDRLIPVVSRRFRTAC